MVGGLVGGFIKLGQLKIYKIIYMILLITIFNEKKNIIKVYG